MKEIARCEIADGVCEVAMSEDAFIGKMLDEYRLEALLGQGGMARVPCCGCALKTARQSKLSIFSIVKMLVMLFDLNASPGYRSFRTSSISSACIDMGRLRSALHGNAVHRGVTWTLF
jgi:hypothetical protein